MALLPYLNRQLEEVVDGQDLSRRHYAVLSQVLSENSDWNHLD